MNMKTFYACLMALFFTAMPVFAQDQQDQAQGDERQPPTAEDIVTMMQSKLKLSQDQVTAVTPIVEKYTSKREALRQSIENGSTDKDSIRSQMKQLKISESQELGQFLSSYQLSQWEQMMSHAKKAQDSDGDKGEGGGNGSGE